MHKQDFICVRNSVFSCFVINYSQLLQVRQVRHGISTALLGCVLLNFLVTVKAAPHEYVIRSGLI